jgi:hypothetical protein
MIFRGRQATRRRQRVGRANQDRAKASADRINEGVTREYEALGFEQSMPARKLAALTALCLVVGSGAGS